MELKDEFKPKRDLFQGVRENIKRNLGDPVKTQWRVEEWTKDQDDIGYRPPRRVDCSEWFDSEEEARAHMSKIKRNLYHDLRLAKRTLYRKWVPAHWEERWI